MNQETITLALLLRSKLSDITYEQINLFINESAEIEGTQLDYKQEINANSLKKHFAAFSNKYGGIIIIGVEEDRFTGLPLQTEGITMSAKQLEQIHQIAANIDPLPSYEVRLIESEGKGFIVVRITEGGNAPYYVLNDSTVYVRTGNITKGFIESASPEELKKLFSKREQGVQLRALNEKHLKDVFAAQVMQAEIENDEFQSSVLLENPSVDVLIQPADPSRELCSPYDLEDTIVIRSATAAGFRCPPSNMSYDAIPDGISSLKIGTSGSFDSFQVLANGVINLKRYLLSKRGNEEFVYMESICGVMIACTRFTKEFYNHCGYIGPVHVSVVVKNIANRTVAKIGHNAFEELAKESLLDNYKLSFETNTIELNDIQSSKSLELENIRKLHWYLGFKGKYAQKDFENFINI